MRPYAALLYDPDGVEDMFWDPILYVERIQVSVEHRGRGVGLLAMKKLLDHFSGAVTMAFRKPNPLHFRQPKDKKDLPYFDPELARLPSVAQIKRLSGHWARAGFKKFGKGPYHFVNLRRRA